MVVVLFVCLFVVVTIPYIVFGGGGFGLGLHKNKKACPEQVQSPENYRNGNSRDP